MNSLQAMMLWERVANACGSDFTLATGGEVNLPYNLVGLADPRHALHTVRRFLIQWCNALQVEGRVDDVTWEIHGEPVRIETAANLGSLADRQPHQTELDMDSDDPGVEPRTDEPPAERKGFPHRVGGRVVIGPREMAWRCGVTHGCIQAWIRSGRIPEDVWVRFGSGGASGRTFYAFKKTEALDWIRHELVHV